MFNDNGICSNELNAYEASKILNHKNSSCNNSVSIHPIQTPSEQIKVEENSASSAEDNDCNPIQNNNNNNNNWTQPCVSYQCNRRYNIYNNNCIAENDKIDVHERKIDEAESSTNNNLLALRDQVFCPGNSFLNQSNVQNYANDFNNKKSPNLRDDLMLMSNGNSLADESKRIYLPADPIYWNWQDVRHWIEWMIKEYSLNDIDINHFNDFMSGKDLCRLTRDDFAKITNSQIGDLLYAQLQLLRQSAPDNFKNKQTSISNFNSWKNQDSNLKSQNHVNYNTNHCSSFRSPKNESSYKSSWSSPSPSPSQGYHHQNTISGMTKPTALEAYTHPHLRNMQDPYQMFGPASSRLASSGSGQIQLWQFLLELLSDSGNANCITWEGTNGEFKLTDPDEVARRWGERKSKPNMNYDKLSRALRYYYDKNIMTKVHGKRYAYKFDFQGLAQATQPTATDPSAYKAAISYQSASYQSADLFSMHHAPRGYPHPGSAAKHLNFAAAVHAGAGISPSTSGNIFPSATSYWTSPGAAANLYSNIAAASAGHHATMPHHHAITQGHVASHIGSYAHYA